MRCSTTERAIALLIAAWSLGSCSLRRGGHACAAVEIGRAGQGHPPVRGQRPGLHRHPAAARAPGGLAAARQGRPGTADSQGDHGPRSRHPCARLQRPAAGEPVAGARPGRDRSGTEGVSDRGGRVSRRAPGRHPTHQRGPRSRDAVLRADLVADHPAGQGPPTRSTRSGLRAAAREPEPGDAAASSTTSPPIRWPTPATSASRSWCRSPSRSAGPSHSWSDLPERDDRRTAAPTCPASAAEARARRLRASSPTVWAAGPPLDALQRLRLTKQPAEQTAQVVQLAEDLPGARHPDLHAARTSCRCSRPGARRAGHATAVPAMCGPGGGHSPERFFDETELIAFSDPNDLMSYPIPTSSARRCRLAALPERQRHHQRGAGELAARAGRCRQPAGRAHRLRRPTSG